jgi:hypothetical protein
LARAKSVDNSEEMIMRRTLSAAFLVFFAPASFAGSAEAAPGVHRPDWVIWAVLGSLLLVLFLVLFATQGGWRDKRGGKIEPPYF